MILIILLIIIAIILVIIVVITIVINRNFNNNNSNNGTYYYHHLGKISRGIAIAIGEAPRVIRKVFGLEAWGLRAGLRGRVVVRKRGCKL